MHEETNIVGPEKNKPPESEQESVLKFKKGDVVEAPRKKNAVKEGGWEIGGYEDGLYLIVKKDEASGRDLVRNVRAEDLEEWNKPKE